MATVAVLDDEHFSCRLIADLLESRGHTIRIFNDPTKFLVNISMDPPDIVIADMLVKGMWGNELVEKIIEIEKIPKIIGISYSWPGNFRITKVVQDNMILFDKNKFMCRLADSTAIAELGEKTSELQKNDDDSNVKERAVS